MLKKEQRQTQEHEQVRVMEKETHQSRWLKKEQEQKQEQEQVQVLQTE